MIRRFTHALFLLGLLFSFCSCDVDNNNYVPEHLSEEYQIIKKDYLNEIFFPYCQNKGISFDEPEKLVLIYKDFGVIKGVRTLSIVDYVTGKANDGSLFEIRRDDSSIFHFQMPYFLCYKFLFDHRFYSPQELYDKGILTTDDFTTIMYSIPKTIEPIDTGFVSHSKKIGIDPKTYEYRYSNINLEEDKRVYKDKYSYIKNRFLDYFKNYMGIVYDRLGIELTIGSIQFPFTYGTFDNFELCFFMVNNFITGSAFFTYPHTTYRVNDTDEYGYFWKCSNRLPLVYYNDTFLYLQTAIDLGIVTTADLKSCEPGLYGSFDYINETTISGYNSHE